MTTEELLAQLTDEQKAKLEELCKKHNVPTNKWMDMLKPNIYGGLIDPIVEVKDFIDDIFEKK